MRRILSIGMMTFCVAATASAVGASQDFLFDGAAQQANVVTSSLQQGLGQYVARNASGTYAIVWHDFSQSLGADYDWYGTTVRGRLYDRLGYPIGSEFLVTPFDADYWNRVPRVAIASDGSFMVVWNKGENLGQQDQNDIFGRKYDSSGAPEAAEFRISPDTAGSHQDASIAAAGDGTFIVVWTHFADPPTYTMTVTGRRLAADGTPVGPEFEIRASSGGHFAVAAAADGSFVVGYNVGSDAFARRYSAADTPIGPEFQINDVHAPTTGSSGQTLTLTPDGGFVAGYNVVPDPVDAEGSSLYGRRFSAADVALAPEFRIPSWPSGQQYSPAVVSAPDNGFTFVWVSAANPFTDEVPQDRSGGGIFLRRFDATGSPIGTELQVNSYWRGSQSEPAIAADGAGDVVAAWIDSDLDGSFDGIFAQRLCQDLDDDLLCDNRPCGNGTLETGLHEQCDDGNDAAGDGCDGFCLNEEIASDTLAPGGALTTDPGNLGATPDSPIETTITVPSGGAVSVLSTSATSGAGFTALGRELQITAPAQTAADPLVLTIRLDASLIPTGESASSVNVYRNDVAVADCVGASGEADPDPCVDGRAVLGDGDVELTILTSAASIWKLGIPELCDPMPRTGCLTGASSLLQVNKKRSESADKLKFKIAKGNAFDQDALGDPAVARTYGLCIYDELADTPTLVGDGLRVNPSAAWVSKAPKGYGYVEKAGAEDGVVKVLLRAGDDGKTGVSITAKGAGIPMPPPVDANAQYFFQDGKVIVQLVNDETPLCWSSEFTTATKNEDGKFKAKAP